jgi:PAS domain S-box-containing protein
MLSHSFESGETGFHAAMLRALLSFDDDCISVWDAETLSLVFMSDCGCDRLGHQTSEGASREHAFLNLMKPGPPDEQVSQIRDALEKKGVWKDEFVFTRKDGKDFRAGVNLVQFMHGEKRYILKRIVDVEEFRMSADNLEEEKQKFEAFFQYATMGILVVEKSGLVAMANKHALKLFGYSEEEIRQKKVEDLIPQRFRGRHVQKREKYHMQPQSRSMGQGLDLFALRKDQTEFPVEISLGQYQSAEGPYVIAYIIDITQRKQIEHEILMQQNEMERANREIEQLNEALEQKVVERTRQLQETLMELEHSRDELEKALSKEKELSDLKSRFVSMASHEFRTPLSTILSSASLVAKYTQTEEQDKRDKHIQRIRSAVSNLTDILNEFLSMGRIEEGRIQANFSTFNIREQVQLVCNEMQPILKPKQLIRYRHQGQQIVNLDLSLLRNVFINLLSNASKFSPEGAVIEVDSRVSDKEILISVKDQGIGISDEDKKHLFERFFRGKNVTNIQGTGLGLYIVSKYVELMNGKISVVSELEQGTTFHITFAI